MEQKPLINYTREAFKLPLNIGFLIAGGVASAVSLLLADLLPVYIPWELPAFATAGLEMFYLALMPRNRKFVRAVNANKAKLLQAVEAQAASLNILKTLDSNQLQRYSQFVNTKRQIAENLAKHQLTTFFYDDQMLKLDRMETFYIDLLDETKRYQEHLATGSVNSLDGDVARLRREVDATTGRVRDLHQRRLDLLMKRRTTSENVREHLQVARIQLDTLDDTLRYLLEQSLTMKNPDELSQLVDSVIADAENHHATARELDAMLFGASIPTSGDSQYDTPQPNLSQQY
jgi:hypothetical protein